MTPNNPTPHPPAPPPPTGQPWTYRAAENEPTILRSLAHVHKQLDWVVDHLKRTDPEPTTAKPDPKDETVGAKQELLEKQWADLKKSTWRLVWRAPDVIGLVLYSGYVEFKMWWWFGVPIGLPPLSYWQVSGLSLLIRSVVIGSSFMHITKDPKDTGWVAVVGRVIFWTALWVVGRIIHEIIQASQ